MLDLSARQVATIFGIVAAWEGGGKSYGAVAANRNDKGGLSYGLHQVSLTSGNLYRLIKQYCDAPGALFADELRPYLPAMQQKDRSLDDDHALRDVLARAGGDPVMQDVQDRFFFDRFFVPAAALAVAYGLPNGLGCAIFYDSLIQGAWPRIRDKTDSTNGYGITLTTAPSWIAGYLANRRDYFLTNTTNTILKNAVHRPESFLNLISDGNWQLDLPLTILTGGNGQKAMNDAPHLDRHAGFTVALADLADCEANTADPTSNSTYRFFVYLAQELLSRLNQTISADGDFGPHTAKALATFQQAHGLSGNGALDDATLKALLVEASVYVAPSQSAASAASASGDWSQLEAPRPGVVTPTTIGAAGAATAGVGAATVFAAGGTGGTGGGQPAPQAAAPSASVPAAAPAPSTTATPAAPAAPATSTGATVQPSTMASAANFLHEYSGLLLAGTLLLIALLLFLGRRRGWT